MDFIDTVLMELRFDTVQDFSNVRSIGAFDRVLVMKFIICTMQSIEMSAKKLIVPIRTSLSKIRA